MSQPSQSFAEFKADKKKLESEIRELCNTFTDTYGIKVDKLYVADHFWKMGEPAEKILNLEVIVTI